MLNKQKMRSRCYVYLVCLLIFCICFANAFQLSKGDTTPTVHIELNGAGYHRDLQYNVQFDYPLAGQDCEYYLMQKFSSSVYISVDQLNELKQMKKLDAIYPQFVDIELFAGKAEAFTILLRGTPKLTEKIKLPIHFRYHGPKLKSFFVDVNIEKPVMFMRCPKDNLVAKELASSFSGSYCLQENQFISDLDGEDIECDWKYFKTDIRLKAPLRVKIPVGDSNLYRFFLYVTLFISWAAAVWFVIHTYSIPKRINHKLEEQRILQKKLNN